MRCKTRVLVIVLALLALAPTMARAQGIIPRTVSYQGRLTVAGIPFEGMGRFKFAVLDSAGRSRWSNDGSSVNGSEPSAAVSLPVTAGLFSALLGDPALDMQPLTSGAFADPGSVLRVWFSGDGVAYQQLTPDRPFSSAPYAHVANVSAYAENADTVDGLHAADLAPKHHTHWGAIWEGEQFGLTLRNTGANPAAVNLAFHGNALTVDNARYDGILVSKADDDGIQIGVPPLLPGGSYLGPKDDGIEIWHVGNPSTHTMPADAGLGNTHDGVAIAGAEGFGVWVGYAGQSGLRVQRSEAHALHVESTGGSGLRVRSAALDGVNVGQAAYSGIAVGQAGRDGLSIYDVGDAPHHVDPSDAGFEGTANGTRISGVSDFGHWVGWAGQDGLHVNRASRDGVHVNSAGRYAVYAGGDVHVEGKLTWKPQEQVLSVPPAAFAPMYPECRHTNAPFCLYTERNWSSVVCDTYIAPLQVPQGARIKSITAYFYLTEEMGAGRFEHACGYVHFWLVRVPLTGVLGTLEELADATPVGPASAVSVVSAHAVVSKGATVNHADYTYTLVLDLPHFEVSYASNGSKVWFKGAQVRYESVGPY